MSLNAFISNSEDLEEQLSAEEFIKTLKKVDSLEGSKKGGQSSSSSTSNSNDKMACVKPDDEKRKAMMEKKGSASELLVKMRSRFQHRATEPVFHTLATKAPEVRPASNNSRPAGEDQTTP